MFGNSKVLFNDGWEFAKSDLGTAEWSGLAFESVDLPHDWLIYNTLDLYENSIGWYRKRFQASPGEREWLLAFDGVYMDSSVYVNGQWIGEWKYGYSSFEHNLTPALVEGENEVVVKVVHQSPGSRWYSGAGVYRNVWLKTRERNYIATDGIYVTTKQTEQGWTVEVETEAAVCEPLRLTHELRAGAEMVASVSEVVLPDSRPMVRSKLAFQAPSPRLWSVDAPWLYRLVTRLERMEPHAALEEIGQCIGFRHIEMDPQQGFLLNGGKVKLNGVCEHHDLGALGAAFNKTALRRRLALLKEMGVNAIRTAHNMPAPELMDLADEMGFLVVSEAFDMWERPKTPYDYARFFKDWMPKDVKSWIRRDRNHPSLIMWSIGNEIYDTHADERGQEVTLMLMREVELHDPKGNGWITIGSNFMPWENARKCADLVKLAGYNYGEKYYDQHHEEHPDWVIYGSETSSVVQSRGVYHFPLSKSILADDDEQCSSLGNSTTSWGAKSPEFCILTERDTSYSMGQFIWTGFDYIGEPTPYHTKNSYFGQLDTATFKKDPYYIYQSAWTDYKTRPMIHLFPYWDFNEGQLIDVRVASNAPRVELFFEGESLGSHEPQHEHGTGLVGWWQIPYRKGELKVVAYDENGCIIATDIKGSFGDASRIRLSPDKKQLVADGTDLIFLEIQMEDDQGRIVENANNRVHVQVGGAGRLLGLDNGDSTDFDPYKGTSRRLFSGKLMAIVGAGLEPGAITVKVSSAGLSDSVLQLESLPAHPGMIQGISAHICNQELPCIVGTAQEIPLRKMDIKSPMGQAFSKELQTIKVTVELYPANTSYTEVEWNAVNDAGIQSNIAKVEAKGHEAVVTALGDGEFRLRCTSRNGTDKTKLISQLEFKASGLGTAYLDPYCFISAGLYQYSKGEVGNGNDRGVATSRDGETQVGFRNIDFGAYGSDTIIIPIFALDDSPYALQIWEGMPGEDGSTLLADAVYQKPSRWNVYQEETYKLSKRLRGITSLCFVLWKKVHIKGFYFQKMSRALEQNHAGECDRIYGDSFQKARSCVEGIGNNVSLVFDNMDFGETGASKLTVYGRSPIDKNTLHIQFEGAKGESRQLVEFAYAEGYEERTFTLEPLKGPQKVTFIFLPGSNFDFGWFRFS
ncbi:glycoside hydrolase family protein [Paenibacillus terrae HPL-003]|uniref:Glycoside hydrolase family protein n=1 Tax=Paenibacillus terrae (strain HPL-003) TaxID=985665 RepID=G7W2H4_PAETH|nr:glycoside hydrolase family 2 TIM barrel-domain containing protein [Paenibacillus terrae]AET60078.1 glycoside hydrolase family protein [Paenibacillus terrae HPL-003]